MLARRSSGAAGLFCLQEIGAKEQAPCPKGRKTTSVPGGGGGRAQRAQSMGGGLWLRPLLWFCGPVGPAKRRRPPSRTPTAPASPTPAHRRRSYGGATQGRRKEGAPLGGGGWALRALKKRGPGPEAPAPLFCLAARGPKGPRAAKRRRPPSRTPASPRLPHAGAPPSAMRWSLRGRRKDEADMQGILKPFVNNF